MVEVGGLIPKTSLETSAKVLCLGFDLLPVASAFQLGHAQRQDMLGSCRRGHATELKPHDCQVN
jgi:hypothetical protein